MRGRASFSAVKPEAFLVGSLPRDLSLNHGVAGIEHTPHVLCILPKLLEAEMKQICDELAPTGKAMLVNAVEGKMATVADRKLPKCGLK